MRRACKACFPIEPVVSLLSETAGFFMSLGTRYWVRGPRLVVPASDIEGRIERPPPVSVFIPISEPFSLSKGAVLRWNGPDGHWNFGPRRRAGVGEL